MTQQTLDVLHLEDGGSRGIAGKPIIALLNERYIECLSMSTANHLGVICEWRIRDGEVWLERAEGYVSHIDGQEQEGNPDVAEVLFGKNALPIKVDWLSVDDPALKLPYYPSKVKRTRRIAPDEPQEERLPTLNEMAFDVAKDGNAKRLKELLAMGADHSENGWS